MTKSYWLMKAEPDSRVVKGKDVKFSVDDFESVKTSPWEGVRNHEAKKMMQQMKLGDEIAFYHSNCKNPGIAGFAEVSKEAYPDYTSWDPEHPYYDPKSDKDSPKWFMVDVTFMSRAKHFIPLSQMKRIAALSDPTTEDVAYIGENGVEAIKNMALIKRGRLSVQPVEEPAWNALHLLAETGGWEENEVKKGSGPSRPSKAQKAKSDISKRKSKKRMKDSESDQESENNEDGGEGDASHLRDVENETEGIARDSKTTSGRSTKSKSKRPKIDDGAVENPSDVPRRRSTRERK